MDDCDKPSNQRGWCWKHYSRWRKYGDPAALGRRRGDTSPLDWLLAHLDRTGECWLWTRPLRFDGYADMMVGGKKVLIHRLAYEQIVGPIPSGLDIDHLCSVRHCARPSHLEPVEHAENVRRGRAGRAAGDRMLARTTCKWGHEWNEANTAYVKGKRSCRACRRRRYAEKVARLRVG